MSDPQPMTQAEFDQLDDGDIVRHVDDWRGYIVHRNYGDHGVVIVRTQLIYNPREWTLVRKAKGVEI